MWNNFKQFIDLFYQRVVSFRVWLRSSIKNFAVVVFLLGLYVYIVRLFIYWSASGILFDRTFYFITFIFIFGFFWSLLLFWFAWIRKPSSNSLFLRIVKKFVNLERVEENRRNHLLFEEFIKDKYNLSINFKMREMLRFYPFLFLGAAVIVYTFDRYSLLSFFLCLFCAVLFFIRILNNFKLNYYWLLEPIPDSINFIMPKPVEKTYIFFMRKFFAGCSETAWECNKRAARFYYRNSGGIKLITYGTVSTITLLNMADSANSAISGETSNLERLGSMSRGGWYTSDPDVQRMANNLSSKGYNLKQYCYPDSNELNPELVEEKYHNDMHERYSHTPNSRQRFPRISHS